MTENFEAKLNEYAHLLVEIGMNVQPGQTPRIAGSIDCAPLIRLCAQAALDLDVPTSYRKITYTYRFGPLN